MKSLKFLFLGGVAIAIFFLLIIFRPTAVDFLKGTKFFIKSFFDRSFNYKNFEKLILENESLKQELAASKNKSAYFSNQFGYLKVKIYSRYPFNDRARLTIAAGSLDGLRAGLPVLAANRILLGKVVETSRMESEVQTIFDASWRQSVGIGGSKIKALLKGGTNPVLTFIPPDAAIAAGDEVINLSPEFPFGFLVGKILAPEKDAAGVWLNTKVDIPYDLDNLDEVIVVLNFP
jgi:cell shape-determining protein MreC